ncbi:exosortase/archaeosortase family protein [Poriferisphaera sp. WC338]|uniref:exosortase/archaeosortase family protein n=1 Tax=Poriferisphaera sp. WC338 TaxID=3425129 RepID=UPI003D8161D1
MAGKTDINTNPEQSHVAALSEPTASMSIASRTVLGIILMLGAFAVTFDAWADIFKIAQADEEASHIFLVPIIVAWLIHARKDQLSKCKLTISPLGPLIIAVGWAISTYGFNFAVQSFLHLGAILVVTGAFVTVTGWDFIRRFWPAFVVLGFLVPVPGLIRLEFSLPMQSITALLATFLAEIFGMFIERNGNVMSYNGVDVAVAEACNGMRMIFALMLVSFAFAFGTSLRTWVRILIILISPVVAIICNVIRLVPTVYVYGQYPEDIAEIFHDYTGWFMLLVALGMLFGLVRILDWVQLPVYPETKKTTKNKA